MHIQMCLRIWMDRHESQNARQTIDIFAPKSEE